MRERERGKKRRKSKQNLRNKKTRRLPTSLLVELSQSRVAGVCSSQSMPFCTIPKTQCLRDVSLEERRSEGCLSCDERTKITDGQGLFGWEGVERGEDFFFFFFLTEDGLYTKKDTKSKKKNKQKTDQQKKRSE